MHRNLVRILRHVDARLLYLFSDVFIVPFCLVFNKSRKTSYRYFRDIYHYGRLKAAWATYVNHCKFSEVVIDRFAMYAGKHFNVKVEGFEEFDTLARGEDGFVQLSSHIGNYEIAGYTLVSDRKVINAVVYADEKASVMQNRNSMFSKTNVRMIAMTPDMSHLFEIDKALSEGNIVSFPSDRSMGTSRSMVLPFLGRGARFPQGPFSVAAMRGCKVLAVNVMKEGWKVYRIFVTPLDYDLSAPRKEQVLQLAEAYVAELERRVRQYPEQWFNFYDFWS